MTSAMIIYLFIPSNQRGANSVTVFSRHTKLQLRIHRASIAEFFDFILGLALNVFDGFQIKWYEKKAGAFNLPGACRE